MTAETGPADESPKTADDPPLPAGRLRRHLAQMYPERKLLLLVGSFSLALVAVSVVLTVGERDSGRATIETGRTYKMNLDAGEERGVYLTAFQSAVLQFDIYVSDMSCEMTDPTGRQVEGWRHQDTTRALDGWIGHDEVLSFRAESAGPHRLTCLDRGGRTYSLVLASGDATRRSPIEPLVVGWLLVIFVAPVMLVMLVGSLILRGIGRLNARHQMKVENSVWASSDTVNGQLFLIAGGQQNRAVVATESRAGGHLSRAG